MSERNSQTTDTGVTPNSAQFNPDADEKYLFEQYKLYVEITDRISQRRATSNIFYVTANTALITVVSWFKDDFVKYIYHISGIGIIMTLFWFYQSAATNSSIPVSSLSCTKLNGACRSISIHTNGISSARESLIKRIGRSLTSKSWSHLSS